jgi:hypothetical protein
VSKEEPRLRRVFQPRSTRSRVDHLWLVPVILSVRPLLSVRVTHVRAEPDDPSEAECRARIEGFVAELRQALPPAPIIQDIDPAAGEAWPALIAGRGSRKSTPAASQFRR